MFNNFLPNIVPFIRFSEFYRSRQAADYNLTWRKKIACWIT